VSVSEFFFFSSRRRHTILKCDWSSDVCSSDLFRFLAVPEKIEIKRAVLTEAEDTLRQEVILASNTSSISMTMLAAMTKRPDRFEIGRASCRERVYILGGDATMQDKMIG